MFFERPNEGAPDFVKGKISVKVEEFYTFAKKYVKNSGYINIDLKKSKGGKLYLELNDWTPTKKEEDVEIEPEDVPF